MHDYLHWIYRGYSRSPIALNEMREAVEQLECASVAWRRGTISHSAFQKVWLGVFYKVQSREPIEQNDASDLFNRESIEIVLRGGAIANLARAIAATFKRDELSKELRLRRDWFQIACDDPRMARELLLGRAWEEQRAKIMAQSAKTPQPYDPGPLPASIP